MPYTLTFEHPDFPDDKEFGIQDLGRVQNHGTLEVDEDAERRFISTRRTSLADAFEDSPLISLSGSSTLSDSDISELTAPNEAEQADQPTTATTGTTNVNTERDQSSGVLTAEQLQERLGGEDGA